MPRLLKIFALIGLVLVPRSAMGFSLLGVVETWQVDRIGHNLGGDIGGVKNLTEEYRWNTPFISYAYDPTFYNYFGSNGVAAIEAAIAVFNSIPDVSTLSQTLDEFPLRGTNGAITTYRDSRRINYSARALNLRDMKSTTMGILMEQLGFDSPERWAWALRARETPPNQTNFNVMMRNFDPVTYMPTPYVNGSRYTYDIADGDTISDAIESPADPESTLFSFSAVPSLLISAGEFYTYLTRDDIGALRYSYDTNNLNWENFAPGTTVSAPDFTANSTITNVDLYSFSSATLTNPPAALLALFPDLIIRPGFPVQFFTSEVRVAQIQLTNSGGPWSDPFSSNFSFVPIITTNPAIRFLYAFENVITNAFTPTTTIQRVVTGFEREPWSTPGNPIFRSNITTQVVPIPNGSVIIIPTNVTRFEFSGLSFPIVNVVTNVLFSTNLVENGFPRLVQITEQVIVTNTVFGVFPFTVQPAPESVLRGGVGKVTFQRLTNGVFTGTNFLHTNVFATSYITNAFGVSTLVTNTFTRIGTVPDILFGSADLGTAGPQASPVVITRGVGWVNNSALNSSPTLPAQGGPGTIFGPNSIIYNRLGPTFFNTEPTAVSEEDAFPWLLWGSFDGSTNAPVVYPKDITLEDVEVLITGGQSR